MSVGALRWAVQQARCTGAEVHAVTGWDVPFTIYLAPTSSARSESCTWARSRRTACTMRRAPSWSTGKQGPAVENPLRSAA
jgi:hypothetical protein